MKPLPLNIAAIILLFSAVSACAETLSCCRYHAPGVRHPPVLGRKYTADRPVDVLHLDLDVKPDFEKRTISGTAHYRLSPVGSSINELYLDAEEMTLESVTSTALIRNHHYDGKRLTIHFAAPIVADREFSVRISYKAEPRAGMYFRTRGMGYVAGDDHLFTQGEPDESRCWFPCFDRPNEKLTTAVTCHVPADMMVLSNGKKTADAVDPASGLRVTTWRQEIPHVTYLVTLCAGYFQGLHEMYGDLPMAFYAPPSLAKNAHNSFKETATMMRFFEREFGMAYPWAKYDQVVVHDFPWGGMENTSQTILTQYTLHPDEFEQSRTSRFLVAHELAHQWFGDVVTCKDWSHLWLNEGFATFSEVLFQEECEGKDSALYEILGLSKEVLEKADDPTPIVWKEYPAPVDQFGYRAYPKGAWVLHMLRAQLRPEVFRRCLAIYLNRHQFGVVDTDDFQEVIEEETGRSFERFFDQWVYHGGVPQLAVNYSWDGRQQIAKISVKQTQKTGAGILLFQFPLQVRFRTEKGVSTHTMQINQQSGDFYFALPAAPETVRINPRLEVLAKITFTPPRSMLHSQLADSRDPIGRVMAAIALAEERTNDTVEKLGNALRQDTFYPVRLEAADALAKIHTPEAWETLKASLVQPDSRVRRKVVENLAAFYRSENAPIFKSVLESEKNPDVAVAAARGLSAYAGPAEMDALRAAANQPSHNEVLAEAAFAAMRAQDRPEYVADLLPRLKSADATFPLRPLSGIMETIAFLSREQKDRGAVRAALMERLQHPRKGLRDAAIRALGLLDDPQALPALETFTKGNALLGEKQLAETAIKEIRDRQSAGADLKKLRDEVMEGAQTTRDLKKELEDLKKRFESLPAPAAKPTPNPEETPKP